MRFVLVVPLVLAAARASAVEQAPSACTPPTAALLSVPLRPSKMSEWTWAASGQMVMEYLGKSIEQCMQANNRFHLSGCCKTPTPKACKRGGWPEFNKYGFTFKKTNNAALSWEEVKTQLAPRDSGCSSTPFLFSWHWLGGGGHMMVAIGYDVTSDGKKFLIVNDPWPPNEGRTIKAMRYEVYVGMEGDHTHWDDYYDVKVK